LLDRGILFAKRLEDDGAVVLMNENDREIIEIFTKSEYKQDK